MQERPPSLREEERSSLLRETADGYSVVFRNRVLRAVALIVFGAALLRRGPRRPGRRLVARSSRTRSDLHGWFQGAIMMAGALGFIIGTLVVSRLVSPAAPDQAHPAVRHPHPDNPGPGALPSPASRSWWR